MNDEEPHSVTDDEPRGEATRSYTTVRCRKRKRKKITVSVSFDDMISEFELWNYIYDLRELVHDDIEFESSPDYKNRIQFYEVTAETRIINKLKTWLVQNNFQYKLD
jgi:hypothetical protein